MNKTASYSDLKAALERKHYAFFDSGFYNLNIIGVRSKDDAANTFNDLMYVAYRDEFNNERALCFRVTTDPGLKYRANPINSKGTGIVVPGQHRGVWQIGAHKGYPALVQVKAMRVYRDNDSDGLLDYDPRTIELCLGGFNCHKASKTGTSVQVDGWSAGCQVYANAFDHDLLLALCRRAVPIHGQRFSYTLLREGEL